MTQKILIAAILTFAATLAMGQVATQSTPSPEDNADARPPVTKTDLQIVRRARVVLSSASNWNRTDTRVCPAEAKTVSIYCALEKATKEVTGNFQHRGAAMQEARFVIDDIAPNSKNYHHRLMDYNNDPTTTFADVEKFFQLLEQRIRIKLNEQSQPGKK